MPNELLYTKDELRQSKASGLLRLAYRIIRGDTRCRPGRQAIFAALTKLEGGEMFTYTLRTLLHRGRELEIGSYSYGPCFTPGMFPRGVRIGRYTSIGPGVRVFNQNHPLDHLSTHPFFYEKQWGFVGDIDLPRHTLEIGPDVWIGYNAVVTPSCKRIGVGAVIGAGAIVTRDVPDFAIVAGVPAKVVRQRFSDDVCDAVLQSRWWERSADELRGVSELFACTLDDRRVLHPLLAVPRPRNDD